MTEEFLLMVFIGLVTLTFVVIAASIGFVAWRVTTVLSKVEHTVEDLHQRGAKAISEIKGLPTQVLGVIMGHLTKKPRRPRTTKKEE